MNIEPYLRLMAERNGSDLFFTTGAPISIKIEGELRPVSRTPLEPGMAKKIAYAVMSDAKIKDFEATKEMNLGVSLPGLGRFRVNVYVQRGEVSLVVRYIKSRIPTVEQLFLPPILKDLVMHNTGLILVVGATGSGKSTSMASMIDYRNSNRGGHILTVEDPIEFMYEHKKSIVGQREAMREAPDMIMIGEVRDRNTMEAAIGFADTGHLAMSTLHAVNSNQALDRIINMFPPDAKQQILMDLSLNLRGIIAQRLVVGKDGKRLPAVEVMINTPYISELIRKGDMGGIKEVMEKGSSVGMQTFDQALFELYKAGLITLQTALSNADSRGDLEWRINFGGGVNTLKRETDNLRFASDNVDLGGGAKSGADPFDTSIADLKPLSQTKLDDK